MDFRQALQQNLQIPKCEGGVPATLGGANGTLPALFFQWVGGLRKRVQTVYRMHRLSRVLRSLILIAQATKNPRGPLETLQHRLFGTRGPE